jgi:hypothetical protein
LGIGQCPGLGHPKADKIEVHLRKVAVCLVVSVQGAKIQALLASFMSKTVASMLGSSIPYASAIRARVDVFPHPPHLQALAQHAGISAKLFS